VTEKISRRPNLATGRCQIDFGAQGRPQHGTTAQRQCNERVSVDVVISSTGETGRLAEIGTCAISLKLAVSPRDENG
jgi:hypothetical protein